MDSLEERNPSLWAATTPATSFPPLSGSLRVNVAVIGGGITGLTTALLLQRSGLSVALLEADRLASGTTGYTTAKVTSQHGLIYSRLVKEIGDKARLYAEANQAGLEQIATFIQEQSIDCDFERLPAYVYTEDSTHKETLRDEAAAASKLGLPASYVEATDLPWPVQGAVRFEDQAQFRPRKYCLALAETFRAAGGQIFEMTRATGVKEGRTCEVETAGGRVTADHVVLATLVPFVLRGLFTARMVPSRSYVIATTIQGLIPQGMFINVDQPTHSIRPHKLDGETLLILGGEGHKVGEEPDTERRYEALEEWGHKWFLISSVRYRWSAQDYVPVDKLPYIGRLTQFSRRVFVATGFKKWGITTGTVAGMLISDSILGRRNPWAAVFDSTRIEPVRSAKGFLGLNLNVARHFVGDRIAIRTAPPLSRLQKGEGKIVSRDGKRLAAHRDEAGLLHAISPYCTHMGCVVKWNTAETTWDCPCHGSRFTVDGQVLQGPAVKDISKVELNDPPSL